MSRSMLFLACLLGLICSSMGAFYRAPINYAPPTSLLKNSQLPAPIVAAAPHYLFEDGCTRLLMVITDYTVNSANCLHQYDALNHTLKSLGCPSQLRGIIQVNCYEHTLCVALNNITNNFVIFNYTGQVLAALGSDTLIKPTRMQLTGTAEYPDVQVIDNGQMQRYEFRSFGDGSYTISGPVFIFNAQYSAEIRNTTAAGLANIYSATEFVMVTAYQGDQELTFHHWDGGNYAFEYYGSFGNIRLLDAVEDKIYVYDVSCQCIRILPGNYDNLTELASSNYTIGVINVPRTVSSFIVDDDAIFMVDSTGLNMVSNVTGRVSDCPISPPSGTTSTSAVGATTAAATTKAATTAGATTAAATTAAATTKAATTASATTAAATTKAATTTAAATSSSATTATTATPTSTPTPSPATSGSTTRVATTTATTAATTTPTTPPTSTPTQSPATTVLISTTGGDGIKSQAATVANTVYLLMVVLLAYVLA